MSVISAGEDAANKEIDMETAATKHGYFGGYYGGYGHPYGFGYRPFSNFIFIKINERLKLNFTITGFTGYHPHSFGYGFFG